MKATRTRLQDIESDCDSLAQPRSPHSLHIGPILCEPLARVVQPQTRYLATRDRPATRIDSFHCRFVNLIDQHTTLRQWPQQTLQQFEHVSSRGTTVALMIHNSIGGTCCETNLLHDTMMPLSAIYNGATFGNFPTCPDPGHAYQ